MAWENCLIDGITTGTIASGSTKFYQNFSYSNRNGVIPSDLSYTITKTQSQIASASSWSYLVGDVHAGLQIHDTKIYLRGDWNYQYWDSALTNSGGDDYCIFAGINEETQRGTIFGFARWSNDRWAITDGSCFNSEGVYHILKAIQQIVYTWQSVAGVQTSNGQVALSMIKSDELNDGNEVQGASGAVIDRLVQSSSLGALSSDIPYNAETPIISLGDFKKLTVTHNASNSGGWVVRVDSTYKFYYDSAFTPFYSFSGSATDNDYLHFIIDDENQVAKVSIIKRNTSTTPVTYSYNRQSMSDAEMYAMWLWLHSYAVSGDDETDPIDNISNEDEGGGGWNPWISSNIPQSDNPTKSGISTGFTTMYFVDDTTLRNLSAFLWSDNFIDNISKFFNDPREIIIGIMLYPVTPKYAQTATEIKAGGISTGVSGNKLTDQYRTVDMGVINVHESTYSFLDYIATKASVYLPYVGEHSLDINDIMGHEIHLYYTFDFLTGACVAQIAVDGNFKYNFTGSCGIQIPTSSEDFSRQYSSYLSAGACIGTAIATIATGGMTAPLAIGAGANMLSNGMAMTPDVQYSTGNGGTTGFISNQTPFLRLEVPKPLMANDDTSEEDTANSKQYSFVGKPTYQNLKLSACSGYTKCMEVHLTGMKKATGKELSMIENELLAGVIIESGTATPSVTPSVSGDLVITFIKTTSEKNVIGKTWDSDHDITNIEGKLIYNQSITNPKIIIEGDVIGYNYCYIPLFDRFFFIDDVQIMQNHFEEISLSVDVLQSFKTEIKRCRAIVERQENKGNLYMTDSYMWTKANKDIITVPFLNGEYEFFAGGMQNFARANNSYVLIIAGSDRNT